MSTYLRKPSDFNFCCRGLSRPYCLISIHKKTLAVERISDKLSWNDHVDATTKKANTSLSFLRRNLASLLTQTKAQCYKTLVRPILEYASPVWDPYTASNIDQLERVQRRAARFVVGDYKTTSSTSQMIRDLEWPSLQQRREDSKVVLMYRIKTYPPRHTCALSAVRPADTHSGPQSPSAELTSTDTHSFPPAFDYGTSFRSTLPLPSPWRPSRQGSQAPTRAFVAVFNLFLTLHPFLQSTVTVHNCTKCDNAPERALHYNRKKKKDVHTCIFLMVLVAQSTLLGVGLLLSM